MKLMRLIPALALALSGVLVSAGAASAEKGPSNWGHEDTYRCDGSGGGVVPPGSYDSMIVTGVCYMPTGNVNIKGDLKIAPGALLDAVSPGDPTSGPVVPATVVVGGNVTVGSGAVLLLGCSPNTSCGPPNPGISFDRVQGNLTATGALGVVVHSASIGGDLSLNGGGGGTDTCVDIPPLWLSDPGLANGEGPGMPVPVYSDVEDSSIGGDLTVANLTSCWLGSLRNQISGDASFKNNVFGDPDATEIGNNLINGDLACFGNNPAPQFGDGAAPDLVGGDGSGQCEFDTVLQNPSAEALAMNGLAGVGINEHFVVSTHRLRTYFGLHVSTNLGTLPGYPVATESGDSIIADLNSFTLSGTGITGTASSGEKYLATAYPDGSQSFVAYDTCDSCTFDGQTGMVTLRAYGTTTPSGFTTGTFLITSAGTVVPNGAIPPPPLSTLTGYGKFYSFDGIAFVIEHLGFG